MPILKKETDLFPEDLLESPAALEDTTRKWWAIYTLSRREKQLMRVLKNASVAFYSPMVKKRSRSPQGRIRESYVPLFPNYVFIFGTENDRYVATTSNCISQHTEIIQREQLVQDLRQVYAVIHSGIPLTPEARLVPGQKVRVRGGAFQGYEGQILRREGKTRLLLAVRYLEQGISMQIDESFLEII